MGLLLKILVKLRRFAMIYLFAPKICVIIAVGIRAMGLSQVLRIGIWFSNRFPSSEPDVIKNSDIKMLKFYVLL
jgi:hypothetical protein